MDRRIEQPAPRLNRHLDLVLTHVDDRFDTRMRERIGADASARSAPARPARLHISHRGPGHRLEPRPRALPADRRRAIEPLTPDAEKLAIDINIVERYQDVYPTKQQTGAELFELVHIASDAFPRVALYFEARLPAQDLPLLAASGSRVDNLVRAGDKLAIESRSAHAVRFPGAAAIDGMPWPVAGQGTVRVPAGAHVLTPSSTRPPVSILDLAAELTSATATASASEIGYEAQARAWTLLDRKPARIELDGAPSQIVPLALGDGTWLVELPRGQHLASFSLQ